MDTATDYKLDLRTIKLDLLKAIQECSHRGLSHTVKWLSELNFALAAVQLTPEDYIQGTTSLGENGDDTEPYLMGKSYFDLKEYDRAVFFLKPSEKPKPRFLYFYARYFSIEKKKLDNMTDTNCPPDPTKNEALKALSIELTSDYYEDKLDGYLLYLYGIILKKLDLASLAVEALVKAVNAEPMLWCAWYELSKLVPDKKKIYSAELPEHWMKQFFIANANLEQFNNDEAMELYLNLQNQGLEESTYIMAQIAIAHHNRRELELAIGLFEKILTLDPYRLDNLDTYSNLLYVQEMKTELADLAHKVVSIDKYRVETCCIIGNYYSLRADHAKAVLYFRRALKLNPQFLSAWTLMGHEWMEMKNPNAAIRSYRQAIEINHRDYRAWYGLGQTYEILKMPFYSLHYYQQAQQLKPNDSRMIIAVGEIYEKLDKHENALKCYYKACTLGDVEGAALNKLAKLYDKLGEVENAAAAFTEYCLREDDITDKVSDEKNEFYNALQYLANYHLNKDQLDDAYTYAYKCVECEETKEQGKALLKAIAAKRVEQEVEPSLLMEETSPSIIITPNEMSTSNMDFDT